MTNEKKIKRLARKFEKQQEAEIDHGLAATFETYQGRRFIWWILSQAGLYQDAFTQNALVTARNCGRQELGRELLGRVLKIDPDAYIKMMKENQLAEDTKAAEYAKLAEDYEEDEE